MNGEDDNLGDDVEQEREGQRASCPKSPRLGKRLVRSPIRNVDISISTGEIPQPDNENPQPDNEKTVNRLDLLSNVMPHLYNLRQTPRNKNSGRGISFELQATFNDESGDQKKSKVTGSKAGDGISPVIQSQVLIFSDINQGIIENLIRTSNINPEFVEAHLYQAGYSQSYENDQSPKTWNTRSFTKSFASIKWLRPVTRFRVDMVDIVNRNVLIEDVITSKRKSRAGIIDSETTETIRLRTNIFRNEFLLESNPDRVNTTASSAEGGYPVAWQERISINVIHRPDHPTTICVLLDPMPFLRKTTRTVKSQRTGQGTQSDRPRPPAAVITREKMMVPQKRNVETLDAKFHMIFDGSPWDIAKQEVLSKLLESETDTLGDIEHWLQQNRQLESENALINQILVMIQKDTLEFIKSLERFLSDVERDSAEDFVLQGRLGYWRNTLTSVKQEISAIRDETKQFVAFLEEQLGKTLGSTFEITMLQTLGSAIDSIDKTQRSLREEMALLENKRGIDQAESVGRLTELGFLFIPISCVASLFSMQIRPLSGGVDISYFIVGSIIAISLVYGVRLAIRSSIFVTVRTHLARSIRYQSGLRAKQPIPTRLFLLYFLQLKYLKGLLTTGAIGFVLGGIAIGVLIIPAALLWTRPLLDVSLKAVMLILSFMAIVLPLGLAFWNDEKYVKRKFKRQPHTFRIRNGQPSLVRPKRDWTATLAAVFRQLRFRNTPEHDVEDASVHSNGASTGVEAARSSAETHSAEINRVQTLDDETT
ncbi:hypothetical protein BT63DRAFT_454730 [Microthyrium microscopicum]|uniref:Cora-domain-containing protein n=1 Tax=Microthyrium microscopicum TaxID=703497 RepID=A0A6A6UG50_9PEZI|nr:hypothetical protein BT63DRAFT_454730 [Microthyrium microscopicum]